MPENIKPWLKIYGEDKSEEDFCEWINKQVTDHPVVKNYHGKWKELIAWEEGDQFSLWDDTKKAVSPVHLELRKAKVIINQMKPLIETIESKINMAHSVIGSPNSGEMKDIKGSEVATRLIAFNDKVNKIETILDYVKYDLLRTGQGCVKWEWDKNTEGTIAPKIDGKIDRAKEAPEPGEVIVRYVPIFNIRPDPTAKTMNDVRWMIELKEVTQQALLEAYPNAKGILDELSDKSSDDKKYSGMNVDKSEIDVNEKTVILKEFWEKKSRDYDKGRLIVTCENKVLHADKNPNPKAKLGYFLFYYKKKPYSFWCNGPLFYIQDPQRHVNRLTSLQSEHFEAWKPKMMVGQGALLNADSMTLESCELVSVDFNRGEPRPMQMPEMSPQLPAFRDFEIQHMGELLNQHEVSQSRLPEYASRAPASLYSMMLEQENLKLDPMVNMINATFLEMDRFRLELMGQHYKRPRLVKIVGENRAASIEFYSEADLSGNYDVQLEQGVSINQSTSNQLNIMLQLMEKGLIGQDEKPKILKMLHLGTGEFDLRSDVVDTEKAIRENQAFIDGTYNKPLGEGGISLWGHDDHAVHLDFHTSLFKTAEADKWDEERRNAMDQHCMAHWMILTQISQGQATPQGPAGISMPSAGDTLEPSGGAQAPNGQPPGPAPGPPTEAKVQTSGGARVAPAMAGA